MVRGYLTSQLEGPGVPVFDFGPHVIFAEPHLKLEPVVAVMRGLWVRERRTSMRSELPLMHGQLRDALNGDQNETRHQGRKARLYGYGSYA